MQQLTIIATPSWLPVISVKKQLSFLSYQNSSIQTVIFLKQIAIILGKRSAHNSLSSLCLPSASFRA